MEEGQEQNIKNTLQQAEAALLIFHCMAKKAAQIGIIKIISTAASSLLELVEAPHMIMSIHIGMGDSVAAWLARSVALALKILKERKQGQVSAKAAQKDKDLALAEHMGILDHQEEEVAGMAARHLAMEIGAVEDQADQADQAMYTISQQPRTIQADAN